MVKKASYTSLKIFAELNLMEILKTPKCTPDAKYWNLKKSAIFLGGSLLPRDAHLALPTSSCKKLQ